MKKQQVSHLTKAILSTMILSICTLSFGQEVPDLSGLIEHSKFSMDQEVVGDSHEGYFETYEDFLKGNVKEVSLNQEKKKIYEVEVEGDKETNGTEVNLFSVDAWGLRLETSPGVYTDYRIHGGKTLRVLLRGEISIYVDGDLWLRKANASEKTMRYWKHYLLLKSGTHFDGSYAFGTYYPKSEDPYSPKWKCYFEKGDTDEILKYVKMLPNKKIMALMEDCEFVNYSLKELSDPKGYVDRLTELFMHGVMYNNYKKSLED